MSFAALSLPGGAVIPPALAQKKHRHLRAASGRAARLQGAPVQDRHVIGQSSQWSVVRADDSDPRAWLAGAAICTELAHHQISHLGIADVAFPFEVVRARLSGAVFLACFEGEGRVLLGGQWRRCAAGTGFLVPPRSLAAFEAVPDVRWKFAWVRYARCSEKTPYGAFESPLLASFNAEVLRLSILGLHRACTDVAVPLAVHHWLQLIRTYVQSFLQPWQQDDRLSRLWRDVEQRLDAPWTGPELARQANMCFEHLRRLCHRQLGRSPMQQVVFLRMRRAAELLAQSDDKLETIAARVGYANPFAFSASFKKRFGCSPSEFRRSRANAGLGRGISLGSPEIG
jgi:AraC-like DNA-binding protein